MYNVQTKHRSEAIGLLCDVQVKHQLLLFFKTDIENIKNIILGL